MAWVKYRWLCMSLLVCAVAREARAVDRLMLEADEIWIAGSRATGVALELDLTGKTGPTLRATAQRATLVQPKIALANVLIACKQLVIREPRFGCRNGRLAAQGGPTGSLALQAAAEYRSDRHRLTFSGAGLTVAKGRLSFKGTSSPGRWQLEGKAESLQVSALRQLLAPWISLPAAYSLDGNLSCSVSAVGNAQGLQARLGAASGALNFSNPEGTVVAEKLGVKLQADLQQTSRGLEIQSKIESAAGQVLAGPVLLDFAANPLRLTAQGKLVEKVLTLEALHIDQKNLLQAQARALLRLEGAPRLANARVDIENLQLPAAYMNFMQLTLATTALGALETSGSAQGVIELANDQLQRLDAQFNGIHLQDSQKRFALHDLRGDLHWAAADTEVAPSYLAWERAEGYGLSGGTTRLDFRARGLGFELLREARLPIFDGAVVVHTLAARKLGASDAELDFDAHIEPISLPLLCKAFGWPELSGEIAGSIPGLTYRNRLLTLNGDLTANVFDGGITGSHFRLRDPFGPWPRLYADIVARRLDLELVTRTFSIGSITGRMDADLKGLELFNWAPVAFDARLYSTPGDRSKHLISQKAVTSISSVGGGAGAVTRTLQSGVLRFFDQFRYDRIGLSCRLRDDVCLMAGIEPVQGGYYIVKGKGLPRIDIIGNSGRVDWPQLMSQIVQGMHSENVIVR